MKYQNFDYEVENGEITITGYRGRKTIDIVIPSEIEGVPVRKIGDKAFSFKHITGVTIPDSVTSIGNSAFSGCSSLTSVTIPDSVTSIGWGAFEYCRGLTNITIPDGVTRIGDYAFRYCSKLALLTMPYGVTLLGDLMFAGCNEDLAIEWVT